MSRAAIRCVPAILMAALAGGLGAEPPTARAFTVSDHTGAGVEFALGAERDLTLVPEGLQTPGWRQLQIGRVEIALPARLSAGQQVELSYTIRPLQAD